MKKKTSNAKGITLVELVTAMVMTSIVIFSIGILLADSQRSWQQMYNRVNADIVTDGYAARKTFDSVVRKSSQSRFQLAGDGSWVEVYYYEAGSTGVPNRYAQFYCDGIESLNGQLKVEYGRWDPSATNPKEPVNIQTICSNVSSCVFKTSGQSIQMILSLDDGEQALTVTSSSILHNY